MGQKGSKPKQEPKKQEAKTAQINKPEAKTALSEAKLHFKDTDFSDEFSMKMISHVDHRNASWLRNGDWQRLGMDKFVEEIVAWEAPGELNLYNNRIPNLIRKIQHISFPLLLDLNLCLNDIVSLDSLSHLDFPLLEHLWLGMNKLPSCKGIRKLRAPKLQSLDLKSNYFWDFDFIDQLQAPQLTKLHAKTSVPSNDLTKISWVLKLQTSKLTHLQVNSLSCQSKSSSLLKARFLVDITFK